MRDLDDSHPEELSIDAPGADEVAVVPWPLMLRSRVVDRMADNPRYPWIVLAVALFGLFSVGFTITILSVSIPRIADELGSDTSTITWVVTGPLLAFAVLGPAMGKLGDIHGHRRVYGLSMACVCLFAGLTAVSWSAGSLIAFRTLGAATGAAVGPASIAIINRMFPRERRVQAMGYWSMVGAGGPVIGVVAGGPIVETFGWRWIFIVQVPLTLLGLVLAMLVLPETERRERVAFDVKGAVVLAIGATSLLFAINRGPLWGWSSPAIVAGVRRGAAGRRRVRAHRAARRAPAAAARLRAAAQLLLRHLHPVLHELRLHGRVRHHADLPGVGVRLPGDASRRPDDRPAARLRDRRAASPATSRCGWGSGPSAVVGASLRRRLDGRAVDGRARVVGPGDHRGAGAVRRSVSAARLPSLAASIANSVDEHDLGVAGAFQQMMTQLGVVIGIQVMQTVSVVRQPSVGDVAAYGEAYLVGAAVAALGLACAMFVRSSPRRAEGAPQGALARDPEPALAR